MRQLFLKLWADDAGALIPSEFLFMATILILGLVSGLVVVRDALNRQLNEFALAINSLNECFSFSGVINNCRTVSTCGSATGPHFCGTEFLTTIWPQYCPTQAWGVDYNGWWGYQPNCGVNSLPVTPGYPQPSCPSMPSKPLGNFTTLPSCGSIQANLSE